MFLHRACILLLPALLLVAGVPAPATGEEISSHGWTGAATFEEKNFIGCHLESPPSQISPHAKIRISATNPWSFVIAFVLGSQSLPDLQVVRLALLKSAESLSADWTSDHGYLLNTREKGVTPEGKPFTIQELQISARDEILPRLNAAEFIKITFQTAGLPLPQILGVLDLRHPDPDGKTATARGSGGNDTADAIAALMACIKNHPFKFQISADIPQSYTSEPAAQAGFQALSDYAMSIYVMLAEAGPVRSGLRRELLDAGAFYCATKKFNGYAGIDGDNYSAKVSAASAMASSKLSQLAFWQDGRTATDILLTGLAMSKADRYLCPGWPGNPRPQ